MSITIDAQDFGVLVMTQEIGGEGSPESVGV